MPDNVSRNPYHHLIGSNDITRRLSPLRATQSLDEAQSHDVWSNSYPRIKPLHSLPELSYVSPDDGPSYSSTATYPRFQHLRECSSHDPLTGSFSTSPYNLAQGSDYATSPHQGNPFFPLFDQTWDTEEIHNVNAYDVSAHDTEDIQKYVEPVSDSRFGRSHGATHNTNMGYTGELLGSSWDLPLLSFQDESFDVGSYSWGGESDGTMHPWRSPLASRSPTYGSSSSSFEPASSFLNEFYEPASGISNQTDGATKRSFLCPQCTKQFSRMSELRRHSRTHYDRQLFSCEVPGCAREHGFTRMDKLREHVRRVHHGDVVLDDKAPTSERSIHGRCLHFDVPEGNDAEPMPLICEVCGTQFSKPGELQDHKRRKHLRRYKCAQCEAAFNLRADLLRHQDTRHKVDGRSHSCTFPGCDATFSRRDNLSRHQRRNHIT